MIVGKGIFCLLRIVFENVMMFFLFFISPLVFFLQKFSDQHPESASGIKLTMAQLYLTQGKI